MWPIHTAVGLSEAMPVRGLSETVRELSAKWSAPEVVGARAVRWRPGSGGSVRIVDRVKLQIDHSELENARPQVRLLLALVLATTAAHARLRVPLVLGGAVLALVSVGSGLAYGERGRTLSVLFVALAGFAGLGGAELAFAPVVRRLKRRIPLTEEDVEEGALGGALPLLARV